MPQFYSTYYRESLYGDGYLKRDKIHYTSPENHTMKSESFIKYIGRYGQTGLNLDNKKISEQQSQMLAKAYEDGLTVHVISAYHEDFEFILAKNNYRLVGNKVEHKKNKMFNSYRQSMGFISTTGSEEIDELWVLVFPSKQYVDQIAELLNAILIDFSKNQAPKKQGSKAVVSHFEDVECNISKWTEFEDFICPYVRHGDTIVIGNIEYLLPGLNDYNFLVNEEYIFGGLNNIFGIKIALNKYSFTRIVLLGVKESFWGDASAQYVKSMLNAGATHILYGSKAATTIDTDHIHNLSYAPKQFGLINEQGTYTYINYLGEEIGEFIQNLGIESTGLLVTVPTVIGESNDQRSKIETKGPTCMDCEDGHIAKVVKDYNDYISDDKSKLTSGEFQKRFLPIHFITDYIYRGKDIYQSEVGNLSIHANEDENYLNKRNQAFRKIGNVFAAYALTFGTHEPGTEVKGITTTRYNRLSSGFQDEFLRVKPLLEAGLGREALTQLSTGTDSEIYRIIPALVHLMVCQKQGYIYSAYSSLRRLKVIQNELSDVDRTRMQILNLKVNSQIGSIKQLSSIIHELQNSQSQDLLVQIEQFGAFKRREAIYKSLLGDFSGAKDCINMAKDPMSDKDLHYQSTNKFFGLISDLSQLNSEGDLSSISKQLSNIRKTYMEKDSSGGWYQTNFEKSAIAALFLEASYYLCDDSMLSIERGVKALTIAHLFNLRIGGNEVSETYGEIIACTPSIKVKNVISLAMRTGTKAQLAFQQWVNSKFTVLPKIARDFNQMYKLKISDREEKILELLDSKY